MEKVRHCSLESVVILGLFIESFNEFQHYCNDGLNDLFYLMYLADPCSDESMGEIKPLGNEVKKVDYLGYAPYGETWVEQTQDTLNYLNYLFTSKERDRELDLYYFGARYLDPMTSRWTSADPALEEYLNDIKKKQTDTLNFALYTYAGNNPLYYTDPNGEFKITPDFQRILDGAKEVIEQNPQLSAPLTAAVAFCAKVLIVGALILSLRGDTRPRDIPDLPEDDENGKFFYRALSNQDMADLEKSGTILSNALRNGLNPDEIIDTNSFEMLATEHADSSGSSPFISVTKNKKVAEYFAKHGPKDLKSGFIAVIKTNRAIPNTFNNKKLPDGTPEYESVVPAAIPPNEIVDVSKYQ